MRINIGGTTKTVEMKTPINFTNAIKSPLLTPTVIQVNESHEHNALIKMLNTTSRPYAVCLLVVK
jgi:hypothetical protein